MVVHNAKKCNKIAKLDITKEYTKQLKTHYQYINFAQDKINTTTSTPAKFEASV